MESFEFRSSKRFLCKIPARLHNDDAHYFCLINDISSGGCHLSVYRSSLKGEKHIEAGESARLLLNLYGLGELELACRVRTVSESGAELSYGIQFETDGESYRLLTKYLDMLGA